MRITNYKVHIKKGQEKIVQADSHWIMPALQASFKTRRERVAIIDPALMGVMAKANYPFFVSVHAK